MSRPKMPGGYPLVATLTTSAKYALLVLLLLAGLPSLCQRETARSYDIHINHISFDPLKNPPRQDSALRTFNAKSDSIYQIIQFKNSLTREQMRTLKTQFGLALNEYIPNFTYHEWVGKTQLKEISTLPYFRWTGNYEPAYKISPGIGKGKFESAGRKAVAGLILNLILNKRVNLDAFLSKLKSQRFPVLQAFNLSKYNTGNRVRVRVNNQADVNRLALLPEVKWIEEEGDITIDNGNESGLVQSNNTAQTPLYNKGIRGEGQIVGLIDLPLDMNHCFFNDPLVANPGPTHRKVVGFRQVTASPFSAAATCRNGHGTHTGGTVAGFNSSNADNGIAFNARLTYGDVNDIAFSNSGGTQSFLNYLSGARDDGAFVHSNSWSDKNSAVVNSYTVLSQDLDNFTWNNEDQLVVVSSGNNIDSDGDGTNDAPSPIRPPFSSNNGLCVAASSAANTNNVATGGVGPTFDNRRKPEIYAPGSNTLSSQAGTNCSTLACSGSSMATPAIAAAGVLVRQYYTEGWYPSGTKRPENAFVPSGALLKATLLNSTRNMTGTDAFGAAGPVNGYPTNLEGWGELVLDDALYFNGDARNLTVWDIRHASGLNTGEQDSYALNVASNAQPLKITLVWQQPPAANANFGNPVTNDLDLRVIAPDGTTVFRGNNFSASQSVAGDAVTDAVNNVEMVLVNNPQAGQWRIQVIGTAVNQGNPSQGYALVATADTQDPPVPTGVQNTLVVLTELPGTNPAGAPSLPNATNLMNGVNAYITEASYGVTSINPSFANVTLTTPLGTYLSTNHNPLIEMTQDIVASLVAANPNVFTQGTASTTDDINRIVILINDRNFTGDWATTGGWPYDLPDGLTSRLSVSISSVFNDPEQRLSHAVCHQLGLMDLYAHPGVTFAQPHVDNWDIMSNLNQVQPMAWSKEKALWLSTHDPNSILWIPRPAPGASFDQNIALNFLSSTNTSNRRAIAIGLTPNVTTMANERVFLFIEARSNAAGTKDAGLPGSGVLLYYVNEDIRQGEGPARIIDRTTGTATLDDAQLDAVGQVHDLFGSYGLRVSRVATTGTEDARVRVEYTPIQTQNDMNIVAGTPYWTSPDIWVDAPDNGYDATPADHGEQPVAAAANRIYFKIHNPGPGTAFDVTVSVRLSEPWHTVGGVDDFNRFVAQKFYASIAPGADQVDFVEWTPVAGAEPHNCIKVTIENVFNDVNTFNNTAQKNVDVRESRTASPYEPVTFHFSATNPYDYYQLIYFRAENLPRGWTAHFSESKRLFTAHERFEGTLTIQPPDTAAVCTDRLIYVTSWMPKGNTLIPLGGSTLQIDLRSRTTLTANTTSAPCGRTNNKALSSGYSSAKCYTLTTTGCTNPVRPNEDIIIRYDDPDGNPVFRTVKTDAMGCYSDTYVVAD
ncbi:MAG: S8 family serine peptidase, partial [Bacteroidota bacterium]|nr:S8 family serine peptidase [Bacteroidota bacterium]